MLDDLLSVAVGVETRALEADDSLLWPEERAGLGEVVAGRFRDHALGRRCARLALGQLGVEATPILIGDRRQPLWPAGVVGSITHTTGYAAAAVARGRELRSVGIDAEPDLTLPDGVRRRIARSEDLAWLDSGRDFGVVDPGRLLFSAKEAVYKAWFPIAERWLGFRDAYLEVDPIVRSFRAHVVVDGPIDIFTGRYLVSEGVVISAVEVPA